MGEQLFLERFVWFDNETRLGRHPNAFKLAARFEISTKTAQRSIDYFRDRLQAPLEYLITRKGYHYTDSSYQLPVTRISEAELLALLISRKLITEASAGSLAEPENAFSFRWKGISPTDPLTFKLVTSPCWRDPAGWRPEEIQGAWRHAQALQRLICADVMRFS